MNGKRLGLSYPLAAGRLKSAGDYLELLKLHLCVYVALSGVLGHVAASGRFTVMSLAAGGFIGLLACGAAVLNNIQDRRFDTFFTRTCNRSLAAGRLPVSHAAGLCLVLIAAGLSGLWICFGAEPALWGSAALLCYNAIYTPLKKINLLAVIPGSLCGMFVPAAGWAAAGRPVNDPAIYTIMAVFGLWQVAHFFIIVLKNKKNRIPGNPDKRFPDFFLHFTYNEIRIQAMIWTTLYALAMLLFLLMGSGHNAGTQTLLFSNALISWVVISSVLLQKKNQTIPAFMVINLSILFFMGINICTHFV